MEENSSSHSFQKSLDDQNECSFCQNAWPSLDNAVTRYNICTKCGLSLHSNCKKLSAYCFPCVNREKNSTPAPILAFGGDLLVRVRNIYDITVAPNTTLYAKVSIGGNSYRTKFVVSTLKECIWPEPDEIIFSILKESELIVVVELWSSYFEFFDQLLYSSRINLTPVLSHPACQIDRWFPMKKIYNDGISSSDGKILVEFLYTVPLEKLSLLMKNYIPESNTATPIKDTADRISIPSPPQVQSPALRSTPETERQNAGDEVAFESNIETPVKNIEKSFIENKTSPESLLKANELLASTSGIGDYLAQSVENTVSSLGNLFYELETRSLGKENKTDKPQATQHQKEKLKLNNHHPTSSDSRPSDDTSEKLIAKDGYTAQVGKLSLQIVNAFKYNVSDAAEGDHYFTVEIDNQVKFTSQIIYGSATPIFNVSETFCIPHFRSIIDINLMDAQSASKIGYSRFTPYELMQREADRKYVWKLESVNTLSSPNNRLPIFNFNHNYYGSSTNEEKKEIGYFTGMIQFSEDYQNHYLSYDVKYSPNSPEEDLSMERLSTHISRFTEFFNYFSMCYQEYLYIMNWEEPLLTSFLFVCFLYCTLQVNAEYSLSGVMFFIVLMMTRTLLRRRNGEYFRVYLSKGIKESLPDYRPLAELKIGVMGFRLKSKSNVGGPNYNSSSKTFGFFAPSTVDDNPSKPPVLKLTYSPLPENDCNAEDKDRFIGYLGVSDNNNSGSGGVTQFMNSFLGSDNNKSYWQITNVVDIWKRNLERETLDKIGLKGCTPAGSGDCCLVYKIPQPILAKLKHTATPAQTSAGQISNSKDGLPPLPPKSLHHTRFADSSDFIPIDPNMIASEDSEPAYADHTNSPFLSWSQNRSTINIQLLQEVGNNLVDYSNEYLKIQIKDILTFGNSVSADNRRTTTFELVRWFKTQKRSEKKAESETRPRGSSLGSHDHYDFSSNTFSSSALGSSSYDSAHEGTELLLRISFTLPDEREALNPNENEKLISQTLQSILYDQIDPKVFASSTSSSGNSSSSSSSTFTVLWNMRDHIKYVQNVMNWLLDIVESGKNWLNWTIPEKTFIIYATFLILWILTIMIPGRILILLVGLYEFLYIFLPIPEGNQIAIILMNILNSIPNDDDLISIYSKERKFYYDKKMKQKKTKFKDVLLNLSLEMKWSGSVYLKWSTGNAVNTESEWMSSFILIQGKRILWWRQDSINSSNHLNSQNIDEDSNNNDDDQNQDTRGIGKQPEELPSTPPKGQILLTNHSGFTQVSPVDLRNLLCTNPNMREEDVLAIFGQDPSGKPIRLTLCFENQQTKTIVENIIQGLLNK